MSEATGYAALRESEKHFRQIVEATSDGVITISADSRIVFINRRLADMLGHEPDAMIGHRIVDFLNENSRVLAELIGDGRAIAAFATTLRHRDGSELFVNIASTPLFDDASRRVGTLGVVRNFTEQHKLRSQLMASDRMASVGTLAAGVTHEINNPLAVMIANLDYMHDRLRVACNDPARSKSDTALLDHIREPLADARESAQRVRVVMRDLKLFSQSPVGEPVAMVEVESIIESSLRVAWNEIRHRARVVRHFGRVPGVDANEARLGQVFLNLIVNAVQALPEGDALRNEITVATRVVGDNVVVEVSDTGPGIAPAVVKRIFDPFFTTRDVGAGAGLGLAICHRIVTDMRGELTVDSELGRGTTFRVSLPRSRGRTPLGVPVIRTESSPSTRRRILVVDDEELVVSAVKRVLEDDHHITGVTSATAALGLCAGGRTFDVILCDLMMPDMTGMELHRALTRAAPGQADRMLFLTGGAFTTSARQFLSEGNRRHIDKPFEPSELRSAIRQYVALHD